MACGSMSTNSFINFCMTSQNGSKYYHKYLIVLHLVFKNCICIHIKKEDNRKNFFENAFKHNNEVEGRLHGL